MTNALNVTARAISNFFVEKSHQIDTVHDKIKIVGYIMRHVARQFMLTFVVKSEKSGSYVILK